MEKGTKRNFFAVQGRPPLNALANKKVGSNFLEPTRAYLNLCLYCLYVVGVRNNPSLHLDRKPEAVNTEGNKRKEEIRQGSGFVASRFQRTVIDNDTTNPTKEERK